MFSSLASTISKIDKRTQTELANVCNTLRALSLYNSYPYIYCTNRTYSFFFPIYLRSIKVNQANLSRLVYSALFFFSFIAYMLAVVWYRFVKYCGDVCEYICAKTHTLQICILFFIFGDKQIKHCYLLVNDKSRCAI